MTSFGMEKLDDLTEEIMEQLRDENPSFHELLQLPITASQHDADYQKFFQQIEATIYPSYPGFTTLCSYLRKWIYNEQHPCLNTPKLDYMEETETSLSTCVESKISELMQLVKGIRNREYDKKHDDGESEKHTSSLSCNNGDVMKTAREILTQLLIHATKSDLLKLLGFRRTIGSIDVLPPDLYCLWCSFTALHHPKSQLTVGARALSKHCHRSQDNWWGVCAGSEKTKNELALDVLQRILNDIGWMNIHTLPHDFYVIEIRSKEGYGLRWSHDGAMFRGFLEPQMPDGHERSWIH